MKENKNIIDVAIKRERKWNKSTCPSSGYGIVTTLELHSSIDLKYFTASVGGTRKEMSVNRI